MKYLVIQIFGESIYNDVEAVLYRSHFLNSLNSNCSDVDYEKDIKAINVSQRVDLLKNNYEVIVGNILADAKDYEYAFVYLSHVTLGSYKLLEALKEYFKDNIRFFGINSDLQVVPAIVSKHTYNLTLDNCKFDPNTFAFKDTFSWLYTQKVNPYGEVNLHYYEEVIIIHTDPVESFASIYNYINARLNTTLVPATNKEHVIERPKLRLI